MKEYSSDAVKRIGPRYTFETHIRIHIQRGDASLVVGGWVRDISESGIGAFVAEELQIGELVTLDVPVLELTTLTVPARVTRRLGTQYGFQFTALSAQQRAHVQSATRGRAEIPGPKLKP